jgi:flagellar hook assembly protein FlgD
VPARTRVELRVFDVSGALVRTLVDESRAAGSYSLEWDGRDNRGTFVSSGVFYRRGEFSTRKMTLVK